MKTARLTVSPHDREPRQMRQSVPGVRNCAGHRDGPFVGGAERMPGLRACRMEVFSILSAGRFSGKK